MTAADTAGNRDTMRCDGASPNKTVALARMRARMDKFADGGVEEI